MGNELEKIKQKLAQTLIKQLLHKVMHTLITDSPKIAAEFLKDGQVVAFPTETVFGLGALIKFEDAIKEIYGLKGRPQDNPLIVHISNLLQLEALVEEIPEEAKVLISTFWPGALTLIFKKKASVSDALTCNLKTIALRMPSHKLTQALIEECSCPIAAPSANLSGSPSATKAKHVLQDFEGKIPCVLEGETVFGLESTVLDCSCKPFRILRQGSLPEEELAKYIPFGFLGNKTPGEDSLPKSPGMKYRHYSPKAKIILLNKNEEFKLASKEAYIGLNERRNVNFKTKFIAKNIDDYAKNLFSFFRECDEQNIAVIYCELPDEEGVGKALLERLKKAASDD